MDLLEDESLDSSPGHKYAVIYAVRNGLEFGVALSGGLDRETVQYVKLSKYWMKTFIEHEIRPSKILALHNHYVCIHRITTKTPILVINGGFFNVQKQKEPYVLDNACNRAVTALISLSCSHIIFIGELQGLEQIKELTTDLLARHAITHQGKTTIREWISMPLADEALIERRRLLVNWLRQNRTVLNELRRSLSSIPKSVGNLTDNFSTMSQTERTAVIRSMHRTLESLIAAYSSMRKFIRGSPISTEEFLPSTDELEHLSKGLYALNSMFDSDFVQIRHGFDEQLDELDRQFLTVATSIYQTLISSSLFFSTGFDIFRANVEKLILVNV
ncbi:hypothetical protein ACOME3_005733 [Neoechinorhynchus agilis]